jgi:3-oxoacyl-[acyl-carrier-protein] synthase-1
MTKVVIIGTGMTSAVGLSAREAAAAVRSGTMRFEPTPIVDKQQEPFTMASVPDDALPALAEELFSLNLTNREKRVVRLAAAALAQCRIALPASAGAPPLFLALPAPVTGAMYGEFILRALAVQLQDVFDLRRSSATFRGRAGGIAAIHAAAEAIRQGHTPIAIAGGAESYRDPVVLTRLDAQKRVKSAENLDAFIPGEGAGFLVLVSDAAAEAWGLQPLASISSAGQGFEAGHLESEAPYRGDGLAAAIGDLVRHSMPRAPFRVVYSSMNGESYWAKEWGVGALRHGAVLAPNLAIHHPADCFGDTGAAFAALASGLAAMGINDQYRQPPCLVYASSDDGPRGAIAIDIATP